MKQFSFSTFAIAVSVSLASMHANAASIKLDYNYMATNLKGDFATSSGGTAVSVATLQLDDLANGAGVRATFQVNSNGLSQFAAASGLGSIYISSFELNFPNTTGENGYDGSGVGNLWSQVAGATFNGGVEWQENGATNGWGAIANDPAFGQEINWGSGVNTRGVLTQSNGYAVIDLFNSPGRNDISVANILANPVKNTNANLPNAYSWIKIRSNNGLPADRGLAASGWWGNSASNGIGANNRYSLDVLAVNVTAVPEPESYAMMLTGLGLMGFVASRRKLKA